MTDARHPERWLNDRRIQRLSDHGFRTFMNALTWSVSNRTDGVILPEDVHLIPHADGAGMLELQDAALALARLPSGWLLVDYETTQSTAAQLSGLEHKRNQDRDRQARKRAHDRGDHALCLPDHCTQASRDNHRDQTRDTKARPGQDRTGTERDGYEARPLPHDGPANRTEPVDPWGLGS